MFFTAHLASNIRIGPTIASGVILNLNILRENILLICNSIENKTVFNCHLPVYFSQKRNFINYSGYFNGVIRAILDFAGLCKSSGRFMLVQRMDLFIMFFWSTVPNLVHLSARKILFHGVTFLYSAIAYL